MTIRIWHQSMNELDHLTAYRDALQAQAAAILPAEVTVDVRGLATGTYGGASPTEALGNAVSYHRALSQVIDLAIAAEADGYDAFVIGSFSEPFLREIRTGVDIPVVSMTEAALLTACTLGRNIALISNAPNVQWLAQKSVDAHHLEARVLAVTSLDPPVDEFGLADAYADPAPVVENFEAVARRLIAQGADVVIPAEGVLARLLSEAGLTRIGEAPVLDVFATAWMQAVMLVGLWRTTNLRVGREWSYRR